MKIIMTVPKFGDDMHYIGKPVKDEQGNRIGSVVDVNQVGDCYELVSEIDTMRIILPVVEIMQENMKKNGVEKDVQS